MEDRIFRVPKKADDRFTINSSTVISAHQLYWFIDWGQMNAKGRIFQAGLPLKLQEQIFSPYLGLG